MAGLKIPVGPEELSAEWLTQALRASGSIKHAAVNTFDVKPNIAAGTGFMGQLAQVTPHYDQPEEGAPSSLIAKFPAPSPQNRAVAEAYRFYEVETRFYQQLAREVELTTPRCHYSDYDEETGDFVLLLQDLAPARAGDQVEGCSPEETELALRRLAEFHAAWWESPRFEELPWLPVTDETVRAQTAQANYQQAWEPFKENFAPMVPPHILEIGEKFRTKVAALMGHLAQPPRTIVHGDYRLDNLFFAPSQGGEPLTVVDWQIMQRGRGVFDVAYFMSGTLQPDDRKASEMDLLRMYHDILTDSGVTGYDFDQCLHDYRAAIMFCWLYVVIVLGTLDVATERGLALFTANLERGAAAISDLNAGELLPN